MKVLFLQPAEAELGDAFHYYESVFNGLGYRFVDEVRQTIDRICAFPTAYPLISNATRRSLVRNFPYGIIFQPREDALLIIAVSNLHRKPEYWYARVDG